MLSALSERWRARHYRNGRLDCALRVIDAVYDPATPAGAVTGCAVATHVVHNPRPPHVPFNVVRISHAYPGPPFLVHLFKTWGNTVVTIAHIFIFITRLFALKLARSHALQLAPITPIALTPPPQQRIFAPHKDAHSPPHFFRHITRAGHIRRR